MQLCSESPSSGLQLVLIDWFSFLQAELRLRLVLPGALNCIKSAKTVILCQNSRSLTRRANRLNRWSAPTATKVSVDDEQTAEGLHFLFT